MVLEAKPDILNHNTETVPRLYRVARSGARYPRTLELLRKAKEIDPAMVTKTGVMAGMGESTRRAAAGLSRFGRARSRYPHRRPISGPSRNHLPVKRMYTPQEFRLLRDEALKMGFRHVESGPLVRSSYHAHEQAESTRRSAP